MISPQSLGGLACGIIQRKKSDDNYNSNPIHCLFCGLKLELNGRKASQVKRNKFCNKSCAASFNNRKVPKRKKQIKIKPQKVIKAPYFIKAFIKTKGEVFESSASWQAGRSIIQKGARYVFFKLNPTPSCSVCGYSKHVEVCHILAVAAFPTSTPVYVINNIHNLVGLCPTHHWEFDNLSDE